MCKSSSEARREIQGGAVKLDGDRISDLDLTFNSVDELNGKVLQVGKKKFLRLVGVETVVEPYAPALPPLEVLPKPE